MNNLTENVKEIIIKMANSNGYSAVGFAKEELLTEETKFLKKWISLEYSGKMNYMERNIDKRQNTKLILENTKSIIVFAFPYPANVDFNGNLKIAKYAVVSDYHTIIKEKLRTISNFLSNEFEISSKYFVDTAPILEKQWALKSGIGWQGKNSLIINPILGSFFNIGIMLADIELEPTQPIKNSCGSCNLCIDACPTRAIVKEKVVDCRKCVAKYTIEKTDIVPLEIMAIIKNIDYIFGCDICQDVCPYNKERMKEKNIVYNRINEIKNMDEMEFNSVFKDSPLIRTGFQRILEYL